MKKVIVSAPGKLHLSGEHAVVYGKPALLVSVSKRLYVTLESHLLSVTSHQTEIKEIRKKDTYINTIIRIVEEKYKTSIKNAWIKINSDIPIGVGMGSSAALTVALIGALTTFLGKPWNLTEINELAFQAEKAKHGNPSGGDNTIVTFGGLLWYRKELDFLKTFWLLPFKMPKSFSPFVLINAGRVETTGELVDMVSKLKEKNEQKFEWLLTRTEQVTSSLVDSIHDENESKMYLSIRQNEELLEEMGVVSPATQKLIRVIEKAGGVAKISGAGGIKNGSGIVIATHTYLQKIIEIAAKYHYLSFQVNLAGEGAKIEHILI